MAEYSPGLEGVIAGETSIASIDEEGLAYRGYRIGELAEWCSFEEVAFLLLEGDLPGSEALERFRTELKAQRGLPEGLVHLVRAIPGDAPPMDALRSSVSLQAHWDQEVGDGSHAANIRKTVRLLAQVPALIGEWHRARTGAPDPVGEAPDGHAAYLLWQITGRVPAAEAARLLDVTLILYAEHEFNASTFAGRVTVSTLSDLHSGIVSAIGALKGPLHGGANEQAMKMLLEIGGPDRAAAWVLDRLERREKIMGFGHRVVRTGDTRARILQELGSEYARKSGDTRWRDMAETIQQTVEREKGLKPNVDFPCGWVYYQLGLPVDLYTPIFVSSRVSGWAAHLIEQLDHNRLIRPRAIYTGSAPRPVPPLDQR